MAGLTLISALVWCSPAAAQVAGRIGLQSDYVVRGASFTDNRPVGELDLSYDLPVGVYLNGTAFGALPDAEYPGRVGLIGDLGYARRLGSLLSVDGGVTRTQYMDVAKDGYSTGYTEIYSGVSSRHLSARLYYSPDYFMSNAHTLYLEIGGNVGLVAGIRLNAHLGALTYLARPAGLPPARAQYDWLIGASRQFGPFDLRLAGSGGGPNQGRLYGQPRARMKVVVGAGYTF